MNLEAVMEELSDALGTVDGLRSFPYSAPTISPPAAWVELPESITYDASFGRGSDSMNLEVRVAVGSVDSRSAVALVAAYADGSGDKSIKAAIERHLPSAYDSARVASVEFGVIQIAGSDYLAATFSVDIVGTGA